MFFFDYTIPFQTKTHHIWMGLSFKAALKLDCIREHLIIEFERMKYFFINNLLDVSHVYQIKLQYILYYLNMQLFFFYINYAHPQLY